MHDEAELIERLRKIEALYARPGTPGEQAAAASARDRVRARLAAHELQEPLLEHQISLSDGWSRRLLVALLRRHGIQPYRLKGQRRTTVMARTTASFLNHTLWPQFMQLDAMLRAHLEEVTERVIAQAVFKDAGEAAERSGAGPRGAGDAASAPANGAGV